MENFILCKLPNASRSINGIKFTEHEGGGVISAAPLSEEQLALFAGISGYSVVTAAAPAGNADDDSAGGATENGAALQQDQAGDADKQPAVDPAAGPAADPVAGTEDKPAAAPKATAKKK